ncbi:MAG: hypothetical protein K2H52_11380 [Lachnospiraceae bacterium]|nr:hypothetical protein [Lachnospiraceae bacterium]
MEKEFDHYDVLKWELFEKLFPKMIYDGDEKSCTDFFNSLREEPQALTYAMFESMCSDDKAECPYKAEDFQAEVLSRGNIGMVKIQPPQGSQNVSSILRAYVVFSGKEGGIPVRLYFFVKRFIEGQVFIMYVNRQYEILKVEEITDYMDDIEREHYGIVKSYACIVYDMMAEQETAERQWSRDWSTFDWDSVRKSLGDRGTDIGLTRDECLEFLDWYALNNPGDYARKSVYIILREMGLNEKHAAYLSGHLDMLEALLLLADGD